jgi:hypothetical protein
MLYILAIFFPPAAAGFAGRPFAAIALFPLMCLGWFPAVIVALLIVASHEADERARLNRNAIRQQTADLYAQAAYLAGRQQPPRPVAASLPPSSQQPPSPPPPRPARFQVDFAAIATEYQAAIADAWVFTKRAYAELPDWVQPILWGAAAATPITLGIIIWQTTM